MIRRDFLGALAAGGLSLGLPNRAWAEQSGNVIYEGTLFITVTAAGGWDPTMVCDPKGGSVNQSFTANQIISAGPHQVAPQASVVEFFQKHSDHLTVFNGLDMSTNSHTPGTRNAWSGRLSEGYPAFGALMSACKAPLAPMAFMSSGGYEETSSLIATTRAENGDFDVVKRIARPNRLTAAGQGRFHDTEIANTLAAARRGRLKRQRDRQRLPRVRRSLESLLGARVGQSALDSLVSELDALEGGDNQLASQGKLALAAFDLGLCGSVNLSVDGFDTHCDHDVDQASAIDDLFTGISAIMDSAEARGLQDRVVMIVGSEFARTPNYNSGNGKDHWPYNSMFVVGAGVPSRSIGATTDMQNIMRVKPNTLEPVEDEDTTAVRLTPGHVHASLRKFAGIDTHPLALARPLGVPDLGLLD